MHIPNEYQMEICLKEALQGTNVFSESYKIALWPEFVTSTTPKEHNFKNHVESFLVQLKKNSYPLLKRPFSKWQIYIVSYGMNVGSEVNGDRPSIVYKDSGNTQGDDLIAIPLTSATRDKLSDKFDIAVNKDADNKLFVNSFARVRQLKAISIKKIGKPVGEITNEEVKAAIDASVKSMLGLK